MYCLLVNRAHFQREQLTQAHQQSVCHTRATLCELIANRILRRFHEDNDGAKGLLLLAQILVGGFDPFQYVGCRVLGFGSGSCFEIYTHVFIGGRLMRQWILAKYRGLYIHELAISVNCQPLRSPSSLRARHF